LLPISNPGQKRYSLSEKAGIVPAKDIHDCFNEKEKGENKLNG